jgi:molecular chaperone DnaK
VQGEREMTADNKSLGRFILDGIPPAPRGMPQVEVSFDIDANGIVSVKAKDKTSGKEQSIRIESRSSLSKEEIERMKKDAEANAEVDKKKKDLVEAKNVAESLIYTAEKSLRDGGDKVPADIKESVEKAITETRTALSGTDGEVIKQKTQALSAVMQKIGESLMKNQEAKAPEENKEGTVRDADVKDEGTTNPA